MHCALTSCTTEVAYEKLNHGYKELYTLYGAKCMVEINMPCFIHSLVITPHISIYSTE